MLVRIFIALSIICFLGCGGLLAPMIMDNVTDNMIKLMKAKAEIEQEKRKERFSIEGEVKSVQMVEKEVEDIDPKNIQKSQENTNGKISLKIEPGKKKIKHCLVTFVDGREKEFNNVPTSPLNAGSYYVIEFNGMNEVISVKSILRY